MSGTQLISVTSVLDVLAKDAVTGWAVYRVADEFLADPEYWAGEAKRDRRDCRNRLAGSRYRPDRDPDTGRQFEHTAAQLGTFVHDAAEQWALSGHRPKAVHPDVEPFLDRIGEFFDRYQPEWVASEYTLVNGTYGYAGRGDGIVRIGGATFALDWKTSRKSYLASGEPRTPFLGIEEQLAAYVHAEQVISWRDAARLRHVKGRYYHLSDGELQRAVPMPKVDGALGIVVTPEFCHPHEIEAGADQFEQFLFSLEKARWVYGPGKRSIGPVLTPPGRADLKMPKVPKVAA